jgi:hypothetical protein
MLEALEDRTLLSATLLLGGTQTLVPNTNIDVTDNATPSEAMTATTNEAEMVVDINPTNPLNVVGFVHNTSTLNQIQVFFSTDGGANWTRRLITSTSPGPGSGIFSDGLGLGTRFDPAIKFDANGTLYVAYGFDNQTSTLTGSTTVVVGVSVDGGNTFTRFTPVDRQNNILISPAPPPGQPIANVGLDKWQIATGLSGPNSTTQAVYIAYIDFQNNLNKIAGSVDGAANFTAPTSFADTNDVGTFAMPTVGPNGQLYVTWNTATQINVDRDLDGLWSNNLTFGTDIEVRGLTRSYTNLTPPGGAGFPVPADPIRGINNAPVLDVDRSGGVHNGRLYCAFVDGLNSTPTSDTDIYLVWSDDQGTTWTAQTASGNVAGSASTDFLPWVAVDQDTGSVNVAYYTTAGAPDNTQVNLRLASSTDGGVTFQQANVSTSRSQASSMSYTGEFLEYIGLAVRDGTAQAFWADNRGAKQGKFAPDGDTDSESASVASRSSSNLLLIRGDGNLNDVIILRNDPLNSNFAQVNVNGKIQWEGLWASIGSVDINGMNGNDTIDIENSPSGVPITIDTSFGDDTVYLSRDAKLLRNIAGKVTIYGDNTDDDQLIINDQSDTVSNPTITVTRNTIQESKQTRKNGFTTGLITLGGAGFRRGVLFNGGSGGNTFAVNGTQTFKTTLNTGTGADTVNVLATNGPLTIDGQKGRDNVTIGNKGRVDNIAAGLTVGNSGGTSDVNIDDSKDSKKTDKPRTVIVYSQLVKGNSVTTISGFPTGGDINLISGNLASLTISAGNLGNTFRIHDTPQSNTPGGVTTTINTGAGNDNVTIDGTTGRLDLNVQDGTGVGNQISVGSSTVNLDYINGPINITGVAGAESDLTVNDSASTTSHQFVVDRDFVQRGGRARIGFQNMSQLTVQTAAQPDHIIIQDTAPFAIGRSTSIPLSGGNDTIDVFKTTGTLLIGAGGTSTINVGDATPSLDNIQGVIGVTPSAGSQVKLSLDDEAATTPQQLDVVANFFGFPSFRRSGAAVINLLSSALYKFSWQSGSGGTDIHEDVRAAQLTSFDMGNDVLTIGTKAGNASNFGLISITGGVGPDAVIVNDSNETRPQTYSVSQVSGGLEIFATRGTTVDLGPDIETFEVKGGSGGNIINFEGTIAGMGTILHTGAGINSVSLGGAANSLQGIQGPLTLDGTAGTNTLTFDDSAATIAHNYQLSVGQFIRDDGLGASLPPVNYSNFQNISLNAGAGGNAITVNSTAAGTNLVINGGVGPDLEGIFLVGGQNALLGPIAIHTQPGAFDLVEYADTNNPNPQTYTFTANTISRSGQADITYDGTAAFFLFEPAVGGNTTSIKSVGAGSLVRAFVANGDQVTVGSLAPNTGGDVQGILGETEIAGYDANAQVNLVIDHSGNPDTTAKQVVFFPVRDGDGFINMLGLTPGANSVVAWNLGSTSSVKILGGAADTTFVMHPIVAETPTTIIGGTGVNTLDYSAYTTDVTVNLATGVATDLAGIANIRNAIGGSGNDTLTGSALGGVLMGGAGDDTLTAVGGRNILVGGSGMDILNGGNDGDILIGGLLSSYDEVNRTVDIVALNALQTEWSRTDLSYQDRVDHLNGSVPGGVNGSYVLNDTTVFDDGVMDTLSGGAGENWLFPS